MCLLVCVCVCVCVCMCVCLCVMLQRAVRRICIAWFLNVKNVCVCVCVCVSKLISIKNHAITHTHTHTHTHMHTQSLSLTEHYIEFCIKKALEVEQIFTLLFSVRTHFPWQSVGTLVFLRLSLIDFAAQCTWTSALVKQ